MRPRVAERGLLWNRNYTSGVAEGKGTHRLGELGRGIAQKMGHSNIEWPIVRCSSQLLWFSVRILFLLLRPALLSGCAVVLLRRRRSLRRLRWPGGAGVLRGLVIGCIGASTRGPL